MKRMNGVITMMLVAIKEKFNFLPLSTFVGRVLLPSSPIEQIAPRRNSFFKKGMSLRLGGKMRGRVGKEGE